MTLTNSHDVCSSTNYARRLSMYEVTTVDGDRSRQVRTRRLQQFSSVQSSLVCHCHPGHHTSAHSSRPPALSCDVISHTTSAQRLGHTSDWRLRADLLREGL